MTQYTVWSRGDFKNVIRREVMDTNTKWLFDSELNQYLDDWLNDLQQEFELVWAINTFTVGSATGTNPKLVFNTASFTPGMLRCDAVYYNSFRLAGRLLQDLEVGNPIWRSEGAVGTNSQDTPRMAVMYPDSQNILIWPTPPDPVTGTLTNVFTFEYPALLSFATDTDTSGLPAWTQWCAKYYVCAKFFQRPGPISDPKKAQRYWVQYQRAKERVRRMWNNFFPERFRVLKPGNHYEWDIYTPPPAWNQGTNTATGT